MEKYKQLSMEERSLIQSQLTLGFKPSWIALSLGRSVSTITRELKRNSWVKTIELVRRGRPAQAIFFTSTLKPPNIKHQCLDE